MAKWDLSKLKDCNEIEDEDLRDWFAGQALAGGLMASDLVEAREYETIAYECYSIAEAMMDERKRRIGK